MIKKALTGLFALFVVAIFMGNASAAAFYAISADKDIYVRSDDVVITYDGLSQEYFEYDMRLVILNADGDIVATDSIPAGMDNMPYVWTWDQRGNYGEYDGDLVAKGIYSIHTSYFYSTGTLYNVHEFVWDEFQLGYGVIPPGHAYGHDK